VADVEVTVNGILLLLAPLDVVIALLVDAEGVNAEVLAAVDMVSVLSKILVYDFL
jgi:hypothetical protein